MAIVFLLETMAEILGMLIEINFIVIKTRNKTKDYNV
jgi:hypothetical protein